MHGATTRRLKLTNRTVGRVSVRLSKRGRAVPSRPVLEGAAPSRAAIAARVLSVAATVRQRGAREVAVLSARVRMSGT